MKLVSVDSKKREIIIASDPTHPVAKLMISSLVGRDRYKVSWYVGNPDGDVYGHVEMTSSDLRLAFGWNEKEGTSIVEPDPSGLGIAEMLGVPVCAADQGKYFRFGPFLNIPHPGTGAQGDPNISLRVTDDMREAIEKMLLAK